MIVDRLQNAERYSGLGERIAAGLEYLAETDFADMPEGKVEIRGDEIFAMIQRYETKLREAAKWEAHRNYIDIQCVVEGCELIGTGNVAGMQVTEEYSTESDVLFLEGLGEFVPMTKGEFTVLYPEDAHMPGIANGEPGPVTKVVVKVKVN